MASGGKALVGKHVRSYPKYMKNRCFAVSDRPVLRQSGIGGPRVTRYIACGVEYSRPEEEMLSYGVAVLLQVVRWWWRTVVALYLLTAWTLLYANSVRVSFFRRPSRRCDLPLHW